MKATYVEISGFRCYGSDPQRVEISPSLTVVHADNSQGKTSFAESLEFLYSGTISRRQLAGGSPGEFDGSLRNAHLADSANIYAELGLTDADGKTHEVRRRLDLDFQGASDCKSTLSFNGVEVQDVSAAGLVLADPPLAAPVLLEHAMRYAVSAKPSDRSDYFKALLEVADLDLVRTEIAALINDRENKAKPELLRKLDEVGAKLPSAKWAMLLTPSAQEVEGAFVQALNGFAPPDGDQPATDVLATAVDRVKVELAARQQDVVPVRDLLPATNLGASEQGGAQGSEAASQLSVLLADYNTLAAEVDRTVADLLPLFKAALETDLLADLPGGESVDCPLCETVLALTSERVAQIRRQVADRDGLTQSAATVQQVIREIKSDLNAGSERLGRIVPAAAQWTLEQQDKYRAAAIGLGGSPARFDAALSGALDSAARSKITRGRIDAAIKAIDAIAAGAGQLGAVASDAGPGFSRLESKIRDSEAELIAGAAQAAVAAKALVEEVAPAVAVRSQTDGWAALIELSENCAGVASALADRAAADAATAQLRAANRKIVKAIRAVLDQRLLLMAQEIGKWWSLLRPDELTTFDRISRRGSGSRYLDLTAALAPEPAGSGVIRSALAVLSNSQLNALGLATFLARCQLLASPIVVLDDPVPGSDREHRFTFAQKVVSEILDSGKQLIITTHDAELARTLHLLHQHRSVTEISATLLDPLRGTQLVRTGDDFERLMLDASSQMSSPLRENRRAAGNSLRIATEKLAKYICVQGRTAAGEEASIADYDGKNLGFLRPLVTNYCVASNQPGQWQALARVLNNADHDAEPPQPAELKTCYEMLRDLKTRHGVSTST